MLGQVVDNCQYIGGLGEHYIEPGVVKKDSGYYVLLKAYNKDAKLEDIYNSKERKINYDKCEIVGEGLTYLGKGGNLCFDSWENLRFQPYDNIN